MWNPLASLPQSNVGALASYAPQVNQALTPTPVNNPVMTPPHEMGGLHPLFFGRGKGMGGAFGSQFMDFLQSQPAQDWFTAHGITLPSFAGNMNIPARFAHAMNGPAQGGPPVAPDPNSLADYKSALYDWRQTRPMRADY